ncbi:MFS transporter [Merismopedia glauca]|uniref:MFS transporter n=1 Tax=Merismopedia glauca CCAP 1448/3 TaxID=1296344 RepID=A0A2T1C2D9_9CYAN|nr:MFS transporter [Merismopedia glauca]PSB02283.1 MFS transporter [Merismopedia glauca CCAP 1448/3]
MNQTDPLPDSNGIDGGEKLNFSTKLAYGAGDLGAAITGSILIFYLSPFLTDVAGLRPELAGRTQLVGKVWDAVNDPMVGVLSDRTTSRWGRRYPWMIWGAVPFGIFFILQWLIPNFGGGEGRQWGLFWYYTIISILFNTFYTVINLPYTALTPELTKDYNERTSLNSFRFAFSIGGSIFGAIIALIALAKFADKGQAYLFIGVICAMFAVLPIYFCVWGTRKRVAVVAQKYADAETPVNIPIAEQIKIVFQNRPFLFVVGIYLCSWLSLQLTAAIIPYFVTSYMRLGDRDVSQVILAVQGTALAMLFVWSAVSQRVGKKATYFMGMTIWIFAQSGLFFLQPNQVGLMYVLAILSGVGVSTAYLIPWSMLPDVVELDELETGQRREGIFYSFMVFVQKICLGIAVYLALETLGKVGYIQPKAGIYQEQGEAVLWAIRSFIGPIPTLSLVLGLILAYFYPITRELHTELLLRLNERRAQLPEEEKE